MTRFKEKRRIEAAIKNKDIRDLEWAQGYCAMRIRLATRADHEKHWRALATKVDAAVAENGPVATREEA